MKPVNHKIYYGWIVVGASALIIFGITGTQFSFGVFLKPMLADFGWSRGALSTAFGVTFILAGLLRPITGYLSDRYSPKVIALAGVMVMASTLLLLPHVQSLLHVYLVFAVMSIGLGSGPTLSKIVTSWFYQKRGLSFAVLHGGTSFGGIILVPASSAILIMTSWQTAYQSLAVLLLVIIFPIGLVLIRNKPQDMGLKPLDTFGPKACQKNSRAIAKGDSTVREAVRNSLFWKLTIGYFF